jgi:2-(1,2-epoxy-1,2-dihydrophenyl)acetyl-CoA isomerase
MVHTSVHDGIATVTLQRPHRLNALTWSVMDDIRGAITEHAALHEVRALVITGAGRAFCAGYDLIDLDTGVADLPAAVQHGMTASLNPLCQAITDAAVPVIAAVNGPCAGGGLGIALLADVTIAAESAYFLVPQVSALGIVPDAGATWILPRILGRARALGMALTGARITATQAEQWGMIWRCVPDAELMPQTAVVAAALAGRAQQAVATRALIDGAVTADLPAQLAAETRAQGIAMGDSAAVAGVERFRR